MSVYVVAEPLRYFAATIGGEHVTVRFPAPRTVDPGEWRPDAETIGAYQAADLILLQAADWPTWVGRATLPPERLVDTTGSFRDRLLPREGSIAHAHGPEGAHSHAVAAATSWLDPALARLQARAVADALAQARPANAAAFEHRFTQLAAELEAVDQRLAAVFVRWGRRPLLFSHPVYGYLERRYGIEGRSLTWEPDVAPDETEWHRLEELLPAHAARWMIWEAEPREDTRARLEGLGVRSVVYDPCVRTPATGDFLTVMRDNAARLETALVSNADD